jgi:hypothetical protein
VEKKGKITSFIAWIYSFIVAKQSVVDLGKAPKPPFKGAEVARHQGKGCVDVELSPKGDLTLNGKMYEVVLTLWGDPMRSNVSGYQFAHNIEDPEEIPLSKSVLDHLYKYPELIPEYCKEDCYGEVLYLYFWGTIFRDSSGNFYVCRLYWSGGKFRRDHQILDSIYWKNRFS